MHSLKMMIQQFLLIKLIIEIYAPEGVKEQISDAIVIRVPKLLLGFCANNAN